jgi:hypothetical protein
MRGRDSLFPTASAARILRAILLVLVGVFARTTSAQTGGVAPFISRQPVSQRPDYGQPLLLSVEATGTGPLTYTWKKFARVLPQTGPSFVIEHTTLADNGEYTVMVSNSVGAIVSATAYVIVTPPSPPVFSRQPVSQSVLYDDTLHLAVTVNGALPTTYEWFRDGMRLNITAAELTIEHARPSHSGNYSVVATNLAGSTTSDSVAIHVFDPRPPAILQQPLSTLAYLSGTASFTIAYAQSGVGPVTIQWNRNGEIIPRATDATFTIGYVLEADFADYTAMVTGAGGSVTSQPAHLGLRPVPPSWHMPPEDVAASVGERAVMSAGAVTGTEPILFQWYKEGAPIPGANELTYVIRSVAATDYGSYTLQISNVAGAQMSLPTRLGPPSSPPVTIVRQPQSRILGTEGGEVPLLTLDATTPSGGLTYYWYRNGGRTSGSASGTLTDYSSKWAAGLAQGVAANGTSRALSVPVILAPGLDLVDRTPIIAADIQHPNGNVYDQVELMGTVTTLAARPGKVTRASFLDGNNDIVQVEFAGAGTLTLRMVGSTGWNSPTRYNQPGVQYFQGHVALTIAEADESTNLAVFSVGPLTAVNQALFKADTTYDGVADLAYVAILSRNGKFGGLRLANTRFSMTLAGLTGIYAPEVEFTGPVNIGEIEAHDNVGPLLCVGRAAEIRIAGGSLYQPNGAPVRISGFVPLTFTDGVTSHNRSLPAQRNGARFEKDGVDVTALVVP